MLVFGMFLVLVLIGLPIVYSFALSSMVYVVFFSSAGTNIIASATFSGLDSFSLLAIPFFIFAGDIMRYGGVSKRLVDFFKLLSKKSFAALGNVTVICCAFFGAISGSGVATVAAIGGIMIPEMKKEGYKPAYATALSSAAGYLGGIIPPSISMVLLCLSVSGISIGKMFICGVGPGIMTAIIFILFNKLLCKKYKASEEEIIAAYGGVEARQKALSQSQIVDKGKIILNVIPAIMMPVIILGGIYSGVFSPTEAAVVSVVYGLVVSMFFFKEFGFKRLTAITFESGMTSAKVLFIYAFACVFGKILTLLSIPAQITSAILSISDNVFLLMVLVNAILLVAGMVMDMAVAVVLLSPVLMPLASALGYDAYQFAIMIIFNLSIGLITPPMAMNLFVGSQVANVPVSKLVKPIIPFVLASVISLILIVVFPQISLFIPSLMGY